MVRSRAGAAGGGDADRQVLILSANQMKTTMLDKGGKPTAAWIMDLEAQTFTSVDYEQRSAATGTVREYAEALRGATQAMGGQMAEAMKQMQEALKKLERFGQEMAKAMETLPGCGRSRARQAGADPYDPAWKLAAEGYAVRSVDHGAAGGAVVEVVKAESFALAGGATEFQPPAGFKPQSLTELMSGR